MAHTTAVDQRTLYPISSTMLDQRDLKRLEEIFSNFQEEYTDHLSRQQLFPWKTELQRLVCEKNQSDLVHRHVEQGIIKLTHEIAIDTLTLG